MNNREHWSPEELAMQNAVDRIREEYPDFWNDLSDLSDLSDLPGEPMEPTDPTPEEERRNRKKFRRRLIAACFVGVCLMSTALAIFINSDTAHAIKFAMEKKYYQAKGWVQATDPENVDDKNMLIIDIVDEKNIDQARVIWEFILVPDYITEGYTFDLLRIEKYINGYVTATYVYKKEDSVLNIYMRNYYDEDNTQMWILSDDVRGGDANYRIWSDVYLGTNGLELIVEDLVISVYGKEQVEELIMVGNSLQ